MRKDCRLVYDCINTVFMYFTYMYMYNVHSLGCCGCIKVLIELSSVQLLTLYT
jgi:hypothetical protein